MKTIYLSLLLLCSSFSSFAQYDTVSYSIISHNEIIGEQEVYKTGPAEYHYRYQFNDRGRGDSVTAIVHTTDDGLIRSLDVNGIDYYKTPYAESFSIAGDSAVCIINGAKKTEKFSNQIYNSIEMPAFDELLIKWALKQPDKRAAVLPDGFIHVDEAAKRTISLNGKTIKLTLFALYSEPSPTPTYIWMTDDMHAFAFIYNSWFSTVSKGYESFSDSLLAIQQTIGQTYYANEIKKDSKPLDSCILFTHASIFQSATATVQKDMTVEVVKGKIISIYPSSFKKNIKAGTIINCKGKFLMPGLWDMHAHYLIDEGIFYVAGGVTHIRDMGNDETVLTYKKLIAENKLIGPDMSYLSGLIDKKDPYQAPTGTIVRSLDEAIKAIDHYHQLGYQQIKIYSAMKPEWVAPMAAHAHSLGMRVCGHIPAFMTAEEAIDSGYNEITHMNFIFLNFLGDTVDTRTPARFHLVGENAYKLDLNSQRVKDFIDLMKRKHIPLDATMNVWQQMFDEFKGDSSNYLKPVAKWVPESQLTGLVNQSSFGSEEDKPVYKASFNNMLKMLKLLYDNGIRLVAGTDGGEANALHHELELYVQAGIPANQVLRIATYNAALDCNLLNKYGEILPGRNADFILIDGDPTVNISDIRRIWMVIKNNRVYQPKKLLSSQGWKYYY